VIAIAPDRPLEQIRARDPARKRDPVELPEIAQREQIDPVGEVMISGLRAIAALKESALSDPVKALSQNDSNLKVRQAATETLKSLG